MKTIRLGSGSAWWGDKIEPARAIAEHGALDYLCFETMAEMTMSVAQVRRRRDPAYPGYDSLLGERMAAVLPGCLKHGTKIVSNQGWIDPAGAAAVAVDQLRRLGATGVKVAAVGGSLIAHDLALQGTLTDSGEPASAVADLVSAEVYLGVAGILEALEGGAQIVITGRVADPSLFAAPLIHEFGWRLDDWNRLGQAHALGHLLECAAQLTGGYFPDPDYKDVPDPWDLGFPMADVSEDGGFTLHKLDGTGGALDLRTVKEQMLYEVFDPANYITPDVVVDFTTVKLAQEGPDRVRVTGISGKPAPETLKVTLGCAEGFIGDDIMFYAGPGALDRARLGEQILRHRLAAAGLEADELRFDILGVNALHGAATPANTPEPYEVALRVAARARTRAQAEKIPREVDSMAVGGVGMTGKRTPGSDRVREVIGVCSSLIARGRAPQHRLVRLVILRVPLRRVAHLRSGEKGDTAGISVIAYAPEFYPLLKAQLTADRVRDRYRPEGPVTRYEIDAIEALNFVLERALGGGATRNLMLDVYGKALCAALLDEQISVPAELAPKLVGPTPALDVTGSWELVDYRRHRRGETVFPLGEDPLGFIQYGADGRMSATLSKRVRPPIGAVDASWRGDASEWSEAAMSYVAYTGRYKVEGDKVEHYVDASLYPNWVGTTLTRWMSLIEHDGETLLRLVTAPDDGPPQPLVSELLWRRWTA